MSGIRNENSTLFDLIFTERLPLRRHNFFQLGRTMTEAQVDIDSEEVQGFVAFVK